MAIDERLTVGLGDVLAVQVECTNCQATVNYPVERWSPLMAAQCPACSEVLWEGQTDTVDALRSFARGLKALRALGKGQAFHIGLQAPRPADQATLATDLRAT